METCSQSYLEVRKTPPKQIHFGKGMCYEFGLPKTTTDTVIAEPDPGSDTCCEYSVCFSS